MTTPGRHRRPPPHLAFARRINTSPAALRTAAAATAVLTLVAVAGIANGIGDDFTPIVSTSPSLPAVSDEHGQRGMRGLPTPARVFPTDIGAPDHPLRTDAPSRVTSVPRSAPQPVPVSQSPRTLTTITSQTESETSDTTTTTAETTAEQTSTSPTSTEGTDEVTPTATTTTTTTSPSLNIGDLINKLLEGML